MVDAISISEISKNQLILALKTGRIGAKASKRHMEVSDRRLVKWGKQICKTDALSLERKASSMVLLHIAAGGGRPDGQCENVSSAACGSELMGRK
jgi:hypothetical protein